MLENFPLAEPELIPVADSVEGGGTIDQLAQRVIPKMINHIRQQDAQIARPERVCEALLQEAQAQRQAYEYVHKWTVDATSKINALTAKPASKSRKPRKESVPMSDIADYDPDTDKWTPKMVAGHAVTGRLISHVDELGTDAGKTYEAELLAFIDRLTDKQRAAIVQHFPEY